MKNIFEKFYEMLKLDREKSSFSNSHSLEEKIGFLKSELDEVYEALENDDIENLKEELGDVLWVLLSVMVVTEEKNLFSIKDVMKDSIKKLKRRKPWIFEEGEMKSIEEELELWNENKRKEKEGLI